MTSRRRMENGNTVQMASPASKDVTHRVVAVSEPTEEKSFLNNENPETPKVLPDLDIAQRISPKALMACTLYMVIGPTLILLNKHIMRDLKFNFPMTLSGMGLLSSSIISRTIIDLGYFEKAHKPDWNFWMRSIFPIGFCLALTLNFGNRVYLYLGVSLIQMLKAFTPVMVLCIGIMFQLQECERLLFASVILISLGTFASSVTSASPEFSVIGFVCMFLAEFFEAMKLTLSQILLKNFKTHPLEGLYWTAPVSLLAMLTMIFFLELDGLLDHGFYTMRSNALTFTFAALLGFGVNLIGYFVMKLTSALTIKILAAIRNIGLIVISCVFFGDAVSFKQSLGYAITLGGFSLYNYVKMRKKPSGSS